MDKFDDSGDEPNFRRSNKRAQSKRRKVNEPEELPKTTMVLWDCAPMLRLEEEDPTKEIQLSAINVTTRSKGPIMDESLLLPKVRKIQESMKKINSNIQTPHIPNLVITWHKTPIVSKPLNVGEIKGKSNRKSAVEGDMGYDIIEDIKKIKAIFFYLKCVTYLNKEISSWNPLIHKIVKPKMMFNQKKRSLKRALGESLNPKHYHFFFPLRFSITTCTIA